MKQNKKLLWNIFFLILFFGTIKIIGHLWGVNLEEQYPLFKYVVLGAPILLVILHAMTILSPFRGMLFLLLGALIGFISEYLGLTYGQFFGTFYTYKSQISFYTVPVQVLFYWPVFIYTGYTFTNSFLMWLNIKKPLQRLKNVRLLISTIIVDALLVLAIDLFMDPLEVRLGTWTWVEGGPYFGVPIGNFIGWFVVALLVSGIFRCYEYFFPKKEPTYDETLLIIPVLCYGLVAASLLGMALQFQMYVLGILGTFLMIPTVLINLLLFRSYQFKRRK